MKRYQILLVVVVLALAALACGGGGGQQATEAPAVPAATQPPAATPTPAVPLGEEYRSEEGGFAFSQAPGWTVEEFFGLVNMAAPGADPDIGPSILLVGGANETNTTLDASWATFLADAEDITVSNEQSLNIAGLTGRVADLAGTDESGREVQGRIFVGVSTSNTLTLFLSTPAGQFEENAALFDAVLGSVSVFEPVVTAAEGVEARQWAANATASSEYGTDSWTALQATGAPDVYPECGDFGAAWASATSTEVATLELDYNLPVYASEINIYQTYSPDQVTLVEVRDEFGTYEAVWSNAPAVVECPYILSIVLDPATDYLVTGVRITVDQSILSPTSWNEIDAVELVGIDPTGVGAGDGSAGGGDALEWIVPADYIGRIYSDTQFGALGGMDVDSAGNIYFADNFYGVWIYDFDLNLVGQIEDPGFNNAIDVSVDEANDRIYVASWGSNEIYAFTMDGTFVTKWGSAGTGPGQFGTFSPQVISVDADGNVYALDGNEDTNGESYDRIQVFSPTGQFLREWTIDEDFFAATDMDFGPDNNLYVLGFVGGYVLQYDTQGNEIGTLFEDLLDFTGPQSIQVTNDGDFVFAVWTPESAIFAARDGSVYAQSGVEWGEMEGDIPEGGLASVSSAVIYRGVFYVVDQNADYGQVAVFQP